MSNAPTDPITLLRNLDASTLEQRLVEVEGERKAITVLLQSLRARERARRHTKNQMPARSKLRRVAQ